MVLQLDAAPNEVRLPGGIYSPTVDAASDADLEQHLKRDLEIIAALLADWDAAPDADGYAPSEWYERANATRSMHATESNVRRAERRVRAIRKEQINRAERAKVERETKLADARQRLEELLAGGPQAVEFAVAMTARVIAASTRIQIIAHDLRIMGGGTRMADQIRQMQEGVATAARALGKPVPKMAEVPDNLPTSAELQEVLALFRGARDGFDPVWSPPEETRDAAKADELARILRQLG